MPHDQSPKTHRKGHFRRDRPQQSYQPPHERTAAAYPKQHHFKKRHPEHQSLPHPDVHELMQPEHTGSESEYLRSLIDSRARVTVVMMDGERLQGRIRYYDQDCFSIGLSATGPRIFLRKDSVSYILEDNPS